MVLMSRCNCKIIYNYIRILKNFPFSFEQTAVIITVTTQDGEKKANCMITVNPSLIPVTEVRLNKTEGTLELHQALALTAAVLPEQATNKNIIWSSSNPSVATVDQIRNSKK